MDRRQRPPSRDRGWSSRRAPLAGRRARPRPSASAARPGRPVGPAPRWPRPSCSWPGCRNASMVHRMTRSVASTARQGRRDLVGGRVDGHRRTSRCGHAAAGPRRRAAATADDVSAGVRSVGVGVSTSSRADADGRSGSRPASSRIWVTDRRGQLAGQGRVLGAARRPRVAALGPDPASAAAPPPGRPRPTSGAVASAAPSSSRPAPRGRSACAGPASSRSTPALDGRHAPRPRTSDWSTAAMSRASVTTTPRKPSSSRSRSRRMAGERECRAVGRAVRAPGRDTRRATPSPAAHRPRWPPGTAPARAPPWSARRRPPPAARGADRRRLAAAREVLARPRPHPPTAAPPRSRHPAAPASSASSPNERAPTAGLVGSVARSRSGAQETLQPMAASSWPMASADPPGEVGRTGRRRRPCCPRTAWPADRRPSAGRPPGRWPRWPSAGHPRAPRRWTAMASARSCVG